MILAGLTLLTFLLRFIGLGNTYQSSDNVGLVLRILSRPGYVWMFDKPPYGLFINLFTKIFVGTVSYLGITATEFWWKVPIAFFGVLQIPLTYLFLKRLGCRKLSCLITAAFMSVLPVHVMFSRFVGGYEVFGVFFVTLALWTLLDFFESPVLKNGLIASLFLGLYLISHAYIVPFLPCLIALVILWFNPQSPENVFQKLLHGFRLFVSKWVFLFPGLFFPIYCGAILRTFEKKTRLGFYFRDHIFGLIYGAGYFLFFLFFFCMVLFLLRKKYRSRNGVLFFTFSLFYFAPIFFLTPPGVTVTRGFMLMGLYFLILFTAVLFEQIIKTEHRDRLIIVLSCVCFFFTFVGSVNTIFGNSKWLNSKAANFGRVEDPGTKAAGYLLRKHLPPSAKVLALHRSIEAQNLTYYFRRSEYAWNDLSLEKTREKFQTFSSLVDVVICEEQQKPFVEADRHFALKAVIVSKGMNTNMFIYAKPQVNLSIAETDRLKLNRVYDQEYHPLVSLR